MGLPDIVIIVHPPRPVEGEPAMQSVIAEWGFDHNGERHGMKLEARSHKHTTASLGRDLGALYTHAVETWDALHIVGPCRDPKHLTWKPLSDAERVKAKFYGAPDDMTDKVIRKMFDLDNLPDPPKE